MTISRKKFIILFIVFGFIFFFLYNSFFGPEMRGLANNWNAFLTIDQSTTLRSVVSTILLPVKIILVAPLLPYLNFLNDDPPPPFIGFGFVIYWSILSSFIYYIISKYTNVYKRICILLLGAVIIISGYYIYHIKTADFLPANFNAKLEQNSTSSGGSRYTEAELVFKNNVLDSGTLTYTYSREKTTKTTCEFKNNDWFSSDGTLCSINFISIPKTKKDFEQLIRANKIKPLGDLCRHLDVCFTIENYI